MSFMYDIYYNLMVRVAPIILFLLLVTIAILCYRNYSMFVREFRKIRKSTWLCLLGIFLFSLVLTVLIAPKHPIWYTDEFEYLELAKNIRYSGSANFYCYSELYQVPCIAPWVPIGYPVVVSIFYLIHFNYNIAIYVNMLAGALCAVLIFLLAYLVYKNEKIAIFSAFILSIIPFHILWSGTAEPNVFAVLVLLMAMIAFIFFIRHNNLRIFGLFMSILIYSLYTRHEFIFLTPIYLVMFFALRSKKIVNYMRWSYFIMLLFSCVLLIPNSIQIFSDAYRIHAIDDMNVPDQVGKIGLREELAYALQNRGNYYPDDVFRLSHVRQNYEWWFIPYIKGITNPLIVNFLMFLGIGLTLVNRRLRRIGYPFFSLLVVVFLLFMLYYRGSLYGRAILPAFISVALFSALGLNFIITALKKWITPLKASIFLMMIIFLLSLSCYSNIRKDYIEPELKAKQSDLLTKLSKMNSEDNTYYIAVDPIVYTGTTQLKVEAANVFLNHQQSELNQGHKFVLLEDFFCISKVHQPNGIEICNQIKDSNIPIISMRNI